MQFKIQKREIIPSKCQGLGDLVAMVAEPVKRTIINHAPKVVAEMLRNCNCNKRKEVLNKLIPFVD
jgi:hypothetical protein